jgi:hypothetical protein
VVTKPEDIKVDFSNSFSHEECQELCQLPLVVAAMVSAVDYSTLSENKEFEAFADFLRKAGSKRNTSPFVSAIIEATTSSDLKVFQDHCTAVATAMSGEKPVERALLQAKSVARLIDAKCDKRTAKSYKAFILGVALAVARAHKESVLPFASPISTVEDFHIRRLEAALGV